ncbi:hypothetical protein GW17_00021939 [Ensete ventricosum]|nr:hypothetical protein GW17_00021939 [Ensete ventricosum]
MDGAAEGAAAAAGVGGDRMSHKECVDGINKSLSRLSFTLGYGEFQSNPFGNVCGCCVRSHGEVPKGGAGEGRLPCVDAAAHGDHLQRPEFRRWLLQWPWGIFNLISNLTLLCCLLSQRYQPGCGLATVRLREKGQRRKKERAFKEEGESEEPQCELVSTPFLNPDPTLPSLDDPDPRGNSEESRKEEDLEAQGSRIRANHLSGDCHYKRELLRGFLKIRGHGQVSFC